MPIRRLLLWGTSLALLIAAGCGGSNPVEGGTCSGTAFYCKDSTSALECRSGTLTALPCRGPNGCQKQGGSVVCDVSANLEGDLCPMSAEDDGFCTPDGTATLQCRQGALVKTNTCGSCTDTGNGTFVCSP